MQSFSFSFYQWRCSSLQAAGPAHDCGCVSQPAVGHITSSVFMHPSASDLAQPPEELKDLVEGISQSEFMQILTMQLKAIEVFYVNSEKISGQMSEQNVVIMKKQNKLN